MKKETQPEEEQEEPKFETLRIGDLVLTSSITSINELCSLAAWILQQKEFKEYLDIYKRQIKNTSYAN